MPGLDKFYTQNHVAKQCFEFLHSQLTIPEEAIYLEPSAGGGYGMDDFMQSNYKKYFKVFYAKFSFHISEALYGVGSVKVPDESTKRCAIRFIAKLTKK